MVWRRMNPIDSYVWIFGFQLVLGRVMICNIVRGGMSLWHSFPFSASCLSQQLLQYHACFHDGHVLVLWNRKQNPNKTFFLNKLFCSWYFITAIEHEDWWAPDHEKPCLKLIESQKRQTFILSVHSYKYLQVHVHIQTHVYIRHTHKGFGCRWQFLVYDMNSSPDSRSLDYSPF